MGGFGFRSVAAASMLAGMAALGSPAASMRHHEAGMGILARTEDIQHLWLEKACIRTAGNRKEWEDLRRGYIYCPGPWAENLAISAKVLNSSPAEQKRLYAKDSRTISAELMGIRDALRKESGAELDAQLRNLRRMDYLYRTGLAVSMIESEQYRRMGILGRATYNVSIYDLLEGFGITVVVFLLVSSAR